MKVPWPDEALDFHDSVAGSLDRVGGIELTRECEEDPSVRSKRMGGLVQALGLDDVDPTAGMPGAATAALAVRAAGNTLCPWPLVPRFLGNGTDASDIDAVYVVAGDPGRLEHLDISGRAVAINLDDFSVREVIRIGMIDPVPLDPFGFRCELGSKADLDDAQDLFGLSNVLTSYWVLGAIDRLSEQVAAYAAERHQFGKPIASFGAIQWRLSAIALAHAGLEEMAGFTLMRLGSERATISDYFGLRVAMLQAIQSALANGHQALGAIGLCEEHDVTLIDRHLQPIIRRQGGLHLTTRLLAEAIRTSGFDGIHPIPPVASQEEGSQ